MSAAGQDALRERMLYDTPWFSVHAPLMIVDKSKQLVPFTWKPAQLRVHRVIERQRLAHQPIRVLTLKARQWGCSTATIGVTTQRVTQKANRNARVVAHRKDAAKNLFRMHERMYANLPADLKPQVSHFRKNEYIEYGEASVAARLRGEFGLNSSFQVDTATELGGGRSETISDLHASEVGLWPDIEEKLSSLLEAVPYVEDSFVHLESTAFGANHWQTLCDQARNGENEFEFIFVAWWEEPDYERSFASAAEREALIDSIGEGLVGKAEPALLELLMDNDVQCFDYETALRKLNWRRWKIASPSIAFDLEKFMREYPATPEEAFQASENRVFSTVLVGKVLEDTRDSDPLAEEGLFIPGETRTRRGRVGDIEVPVSVTWVPRDATGFGVGHDFWRIWERPYKAGELLPKLNPDWTEEEKPAIRDGQYVVTVDSSGDAETSSGEGDWDAIQVIDHRSGCQVAEYRTRCDPDELARQALLAAVFYNRAWLGVEVNNYGAAIALALQFDYGYEMMYERPRGSMENRKQKASQNLGWLTSEASKRVLIALAKELLRTETTGIRSMKLAREMASFIILNDRGRTGARRGNFDDLLMAWMIAQQIAREKPLLPDKRHGPPKTSWIRPPRDAATGW